MVTGVKAMFVPGALIIKFDKQVYWCQALQCLHAATKQTEVVIHVSCGMHVLVVPLNVLSITNCIVFVIVNHDGYSIITFCVTCYPGVVFLGSYARS